MPKSSRGRLTALFFLSAATLPLHAADSEGRYALEGPGRINCQALADMDGGSQNMQLLAAWTLGYMSAHNRVLSDTFDITPWQNIESVIALARQYCAANPDAPFETALQQLMSFLAPTRLKQDEPLVRIGTDDLQGVVYKSTLQLARQKLADNGFPVATDEAGLAQSLKTFQSDNDIPATGILDQRTMSLLFK